MEVFQARPVGPSCNQMFQQEDVWIQFVSCGKTKRRLVENF